MSASQQGSDNYGLLDKVKGRIPNMIDIHPQADPDEIESIIENEGGSDERTAYALQTAMGRAAGAGGSLQLPNSDNDELTEYVDDHELRSLMNEYDGDLRQASPEEIDGVFNTEADTKQFAANLHTEYEQSTGYGMITPWESFTGELEEYAQEEFDGVQQIATSGGKKEEVKTGYDKLSGAISDFSGEHPLITGGGLSLLALGGMTGLGMLVDSSFDQNLSDYDDNSTDGENDNETGGVSGDFTFGDVDRSLSKSNASEFMVNAYLGDNVSEEHRDEVYEVFDEELENESELSARITEDGNISQQYFKDEYTANGTNTTVDENLTLSEMLDYEEIRNEAINQSQSDRELLDNIARFEELHKHETENDSERFRAGLESLETAINLDSQSEAGNVTTNEIGPYNSTSVNETGLNNTDLNSTRSASDNSTAENETYTDRFFQEMGNGDFDTIVNASEIGEEYENTTIDVDEEYVLKGFLDEETTAREIDYLHGNVLSDNETQIQNVTADPLDNEWNGTDNLAVMDLGMAPTESHELLERYEFDRTEVRENGHNNDYNITLEGDNGFTTRTNSSQLSMFGTAFQDINEKYNQNENIVSSEITRDTTSQDLWRSVSDFGFRFLDQDPETTTDMVKMSAVDERTTDDRSWSVGVGELMHYGMNHFTPHMSDSEAMEYFRAMPDDENVDNNLEFNSKEFSEASNQAYGFDGYSRPSIHKHNIEELGDAVEAGVDVDPRQFDGYGDSGGGSSSTSTTDDDNGDDGDDGDNSDGGWGTGGSGGNPS